MGLWSKHNGIWKEVSFANKMSDKDFYLCCGGPSLKKITQEKIRVPGALIIAMNNAYPYIRPDIWIGMDHPHCYHRQIFWEPFVKIMRGGFQTKTCEGVEICENYNLFYADVRKYHDWGAELFKPPTKETNFIWKKNVMTVAIHILFYLGAKKINIVGCDLAHTNSSHYHDENVKLNAHQANWNQRTYNEIFSFLKLVVPKAKKRGIEINSCTPESRINEIMPYVPIEEALSKTQEKVVFNGKLYHSSFVPDDPTR
tara:strand:- start:1110 stop:1877 length:768 start_codon:yes stop_codon:yes gene_type:complete